MNKGIFMWVQSAQCNGPTGWSVPKASMEFWTILFSLCRDFWLTMSSHLYWTENQKGRWGLRFPFCKWRPTAVRQIFHWTEYSISMPGTLNERERRQFSQPFHQHLSSSEKRTNRNIIGVDDSCESSVTNETSSFRTSINELDWVLCFTAHHQSKKAEFPKQTNSGAKHFVNAASRQD